MSATTGLPLVTREPHMTPPKGDEVQEWKMLGSGGDAAPSSPVPARLALGGVDTPQGSPSSSQAATKKGPNDFIFGKVIGEGSFSTVYLAKDVQSGREYAIKVCDKRHILREKKTEYVKREKEALTILSANSKVQTPFFVKLFCTFQDVDRLYYVLTYAKRGELLPYITRVGSFDDECSQFYAAEIFYALEHMHSVGIIHRDLKPENILLSEKMHILITDFGSAKILHKEAAGQPSASTSLTRKNSFVGTAQYVSPELLTDKTASASSDLWALGCIIYQMVAGLPPFCAHNEYHIFQKILKLEYEFPEGFLPRAKDIVQKLLVLNPSQRLGATDKEGYMSIKAHPFFASVNFDTLYLQTPPQIYPYLPGTKESEALRSHYRVPDDLEPGLDDKQMTRLLGLDLQDDETSSARQPPPPAPVAPSSSPSASQSDVTPSPRRRKLTLLGLPSDEQEAKLKLQASENKWHRFVDGHLILKQGLVDKHKGLFARRRMVLLTTGPHLYYVDPANMVLKGEIPWSSALRVEPKNFKIFFVHTPNRTYYLEDPDGYALEWCAAIDEVRKFTYGLET